MLPGGCPHWPLPLPLPLAHMAGVADLFNPPERSKSAAFQVSIAFAALS